MLFVVRNYPALFLSPYLTHIRLNFKSNSKDRVNTFFVHKNSISITLWKKEKNNPKYFQFLELKS